MVAAVVLAAGESARMGTPKALLPDPEGRLFVTRIVRSFAEAEVADVIVVTGSRHAEIAAALASDGLTPRLVRNPDPSRGQLSSIWTALDEIESSAHDGMLVTLVDIPMMSAATVRRVVETWRSTRAPIVRPAVGDRHGHPVLFDRVVFDALRAAPLDQGAKAVLRAWADRIVNVEVDDPGCVRDVDTPEEYRALIESARP